MTWNDLPDIDDLEPIGDADISALNAIREILQTRGLAQRFGVLLLHKHFDVEDDEQLVEVIDKENRTLTTSPRPTSSEQAGDATPTSFRFVDTAIPVEALQYCYREPGWPDWLHAQ